MASINTLINNISNQNISFFFENKITSFKPEKDVFINTVNEESPYSDPIKIGFAALKNHEELLVFTCEYNKELTARSAKKQQFEIAKKVLKEDFKDGAIFIFYDAQGNFRFSFIRRNYGNKTAKYSNWKRFTYYVSPSETNKTFKERINNCSFNDLDSIQEAFSVEKLTKEFYNELFAWYQWALSDDIGVTFPNNTKTSDDDRVQLEEQIIRLITRLLFVWFIKQKKIVPNKFFDSDEISKILKDFNYNDRNKGNYYNAILQNLFFATLNKEINEREFSKIKSRDIKTRYRYEEMFNLSEKEIIALFKPIPFLNGGLFECLDKEDVDGNKYFLDGFSRNPTKSANGNYKHRAFIPNCVFFDDEKGIIPLLKRYNFTVEENAPNEVQVALDPELLGKVFENLLGAFNPETKETARKQSGSFYTPREIVDYMVDESLINYLQNKLPDIEKRTIRNLFESDKLPDVFTNNNDLCNKIATKLKTIKILDPACGSGAFPMGILNKMVEILKRLDNKNTQSIHDLKLHLIEECIYGIDIQTIATQISKLRFFITLVVEQNEIDLSKPEQNYGILTLPNLETKFVSANTLIGVKKKKEGEFVNTLFTNPEIENTKEELHKIRKEHFYAKTAGAKKRLREKDTILRSKLTLLLKENNEFAPEDAIQFSKWNPYDQNSSSPFFDLEWMFGLDEGFDIVIGNPPYVNVEKIDKSIKNIIKNFKTAYQKYDLYVLFYEIGINLLKEGGVLSYITSNKFLSQGYGFKLRQFFLKFKINRIINFNYDVFDAATVRTCIFEITKLPIEKNDIKVIDVNIEADKHLFENKTYKKVNQDVFNKTDNNNFRINLTKEKIKLLEKISIDTLRVDDICSVNYGLRPVSLIKGDDKTSFIKDTFAFGYKKYFEGKDTGYWNTKNHRYLDYKKEEIYNPMFEELFEKPKLAGLCTLSEINKLRFIYDSKGFYCNHSLAILTLWKDFKNVNYQTIRRLISDTKIKISENYSLHYLQGILNSKLIKFYVNELLYDGTHFYPNHMKQLPIKIKSIHFDKIERLVLEIRNDNDNTDLVSELDIMVYKLYNLTYQEVLIIDPAFSLTQEEYDKYKA